MRGLSAKEVQRRLAGGADLGGPGQGRSGDLDRRAHDPRATVGRDTLTILGGALLAVILGNLAGFGAPVDGLASPTPRDTGTIIGGGSLPPIATFPPIDTLGGIVDPTVGFEATPTPIPVITLGPSPTPSPTPRQTVKPTTRPSATPGPTPTPAPVAIMDCTVVDLTATCDGSGSQHVKPNDPSAYSWDFGDGATTTGSNVQHTYAGTGTYTVTLTVTGLDGVTTNASFQDVAPVATPGP